MLLRIVLNWVVLVLLLVLLVSGLGSWIGEVELVVLGVVLLAIGVFRTRKILSEQNA